MTRIVFAFLMVLATGLMVAGCHAEGEVGPDDTTSVLAPR